MNPQTNTFTVCTEVQGRGKTLFLWHLQVDALLFAVRFPHSDPPIFQLTPDGMNAAGGLTSLFGPIPISDDWIITAREDAPEGNVPACIDYAVLRDSATNCVMYDT